ncbi:MAG: acetyl-CoA carboxylase biotin carboxyl carrier protein [Deltaproteobacteria bacterium]|nr:MAG: acetyl-CoA carboxylase biotin carboxyl carrier protein [Deltaproteobacteria bacterium]
MDLERVEALLKLMHEYGVVELGMETEEGSIELRLQGAVAPVAAAPAPMAAPVQHAPAGSAPAEADDGTITIDSPMVGTFYRAPKPGAKPFVSVGDRVHKGQVLCILEAMKLMNELESEVSGTIVEILVENAEPVQFGQPLFRIRPD